MTIIVTGFRVNKLLCKGHDMRYAIDPTKIHRELGWLPETKFAGEQLYRGNIRITTERGGGNESVCYRCGGAAGA